MLDQICIDDFNEGQVKATGTGILASEAEDIIKSSTRKAETRSACLPKMPCESTTEHPRTVADTATMFLVQPGKRALEPWTNPVEFTAGLIIESFYQVVDFLVSDGENSFTPAPI